ncbi:hypothetical protein [Azospirillum sp.]|uniref:hypothetical protein n=1 Tax=Azospirillum sp. TaxID=34012 RepID=UPI003D7441B2
MTVMVLPANGLSSGDVVTVTRFAKVLAAKRTATDARDLFERRGVRGLFAVAGEAERCAACLDGLGLGSLAATNRALAARMRGRAADLLG